MSRFPSITLGLGRFVYKRRISLCLIKLLTQLRHGDGTVSEKKGCCYDLAVVSPWDVVANEPVGRAWIGGVEKQLHPTRKMLRRIMSDKS